MNFYSYRILEELYDYEVDPCALNNLIADPQYARVLGEYRWAVMAKMESTADPLAATFAAFIALMDSPGDLDQDNDVDLEDFGVFQACLGAGDQVPPLSGCEDTDLDFDDEVDADDLVKFLGCISGADIPRELTCLN